MDEIGSQVVGDELNSFHLGDAKSSGTSASFLFRCPGRVSMVGFPTVPKDSHVEKTWSSSILRKRKSLRRHYEEGVRMTTQGGVQRKQSD